MIKYMLLLTIVSASSGRPKENNVNAWNMVTVPTNCPEGQQLVNGVCRDIWLYDAVLNILKDVEISQYSNQNDPRNMVTVPTNCPPGQELVNGVCRDIWRLRTSPIPPSIEESARYEKENGPLNMITVPTSCPPGQQLINGVCRDIWRFGPSSPIPQSLEESNKNSVLEKIIKSITTELFYRRQKRQVDFDAEQILSMLDETIVNKNIITVPNQCPAGYKPDIFGICRPIFD